MRQFRTYEQNLNKVNSGPLIFFIYLSWSLILYKQLIVWKLSLITSIIFLCIRSVGSLWS